MAKNLIKPAFNYSVLPSERYGRGNIDLYDRPVVLNDDNTISTVRSMSFHDDISEKEILIPTISDDGTVLSDDEAIENYYNTGKYLAICDTVEEADLYAKEIHDKQDKIYGNVNRGF